MIIMAKSKAEDFRPHWCRDIEASWWRPAILKLEEPLRGAVAAVVWWDIFSNLILTKRYAGLDDLITSASNVSDEELVAGLIRVGYPRDRANSRVNHQNRKKRSKAG